MKISLLFSALSACVLLAGCPRPHNPQQRAGAVPVPSGIV
ncbi:pilus assembly protein PilL, partial [Enterobacter cloacae]